MIQITVAVHTYLMPTMGRMEHFMTLLNFISFLGGLALFLFGMTTLSRGLEKTSEGKLESVLEKLTNNLPKAIIFGMLVTAAIQSSSATTVVVVGLVSARVLKLRQAIGIIMGANIGTTITAHILSLTEISSSNLLLLLIKPSNLAPTMAAIGIVMYFACKKDKQREIGQILLGFAVLFSGMFQMEDAMSPIRDMPEFAEMFQTMSNPVVGVLTGAGLTAVIQSSSASVGILQALSTTGQITFASAVPIILGQNIGTCITPVLASIGASKGAKRASLVHVCFNIGGSVIFLIAIYSVQAFVVLPFWYDAITKSDIANFHTVFNIATTLLFIPFVTLMEKMVYKIIPIDAQEDEMADALSVLDERLLVSPGLAIEHCQEAVLHMSSAAKESYTIARKLIMGERGNLAEELRKNERFIDSLQDKIQNYSFKITKCHLTEANKTKLTELLHMVSEFERVGDRCENILVSLEEKDIDFSDAAKKELINLLDAVDEILTLATDSYKKGDYSEVHRVEPLEQIIDTIEEQLRARHIARLRAGECTVDNAFAFVEILGSLERIADNCSNVAMFMVATQEGYNNFDTHAYLKSLHRGESEVYMQYYKEYQQKYM